MSTNESIKNPEIEKLLMKLDAKENENSKLLALFDELSKQFEMQTEELNKDSKSRITLVSAVHKLTNMNQYLSDKLTIANKKIDNLSNDNAALLSQVEKCELPHKFIEEMGELKESILRVVPDETQQFVRPLLSKESDTYGERIVKTISSLVEYFDKHQAKSSNEAELELQQQKQKELNDTLMGVLSSNLRFINELVESKEKAQWIMKPFSFEESRELILEQVTRINNFLNDYHIVPTDLQTLFDTLMLDVDPINAQADLSTILEDFLPPETERENKLFTYLSQCIAINDVMRKFALECRTQCAHQIAEIKQLRVELENTKIDFENRVSDEQIPLKNKISEQNDEINKLKQKIDQIRQEVQNTANSKAILDIIDTVGLPETEEKPVEQENNKLQPDIQQGVEILDQMDENENSQKSLIDLLENKSEELSNTQEELSQTRREKQDLENEIKRLTEQHEAENSQNIAHIVKIESLLRTTEENYEQQTQQMTNELERLRQINETTKKELEEVKAALRGAEDLDKFDEQDNKIRQLKRDNRALARSLLDQRDATQQAVKKVLEKSKSKIDKMKAELTKVCKESASVIDAQEKVIKDHEAKISSSEAKINEFTKLTTDLQAELTKTNAQVSCLEMEKRMLETKMSSHDEKAKRDRSLLENQYKLKMLSTETECQAKIERQRVYYENQLSQIINSIQTYLLKDESAPKNDDSNSTISQEAAIDILRRTSDQLSQSQHTEKVLDDLRAEISVIRSNLQTPKNESLTTYSQKVMEDQNKYKEQIKNLEAKVKGMKREVIEARSISQQEKTNRDWEEWARKLNMLVSDGYCSISSPKDLRFAVEEIVFASLGNRLTWNRLDSLRFQKKLLKSGKDLKQAKGETLRSAIYVAIAVRRLQKISGHVQTKLTVEIPSCIERKSAPPDPVPIEKKPLFKQFISKN